MAEGPDEFPDVAIPARSALIILVGLAMAYAGAFLLLGQHVHSSFPFMIASAVLAVALLALSYIDLRTGLLLDILTLPLTALGLAFSVWTGDWMFSLAGAILGYAMIAWLAYYWRVRRGYEGIGLGDAKLLAAGGAWVGISGIPILLLIASSVGIIAAIAVSQITRSTSDRIAIPFGPSLALGIWVVWCGIEMMLLG
ncbi:MAG: prepilin peptidase [Henriciella sp.]|nr:prepilin peptidase [Henriciella sp.]